MNKQKIILFDIDYTLFDTTKFKKLLAQEIAKITHQSFDGFYELLEEVYYKARFDNHFEPALFPKALQDRVKTVVTNKELENVWFDKNLIKQAIYPEVESVLQKLQSKNIELGIFSTGNSEFQLAKISLFEDYLHKKHIHIFSNKEEKVDELISEYKDYPLFMVDDFLSILFRAKKIKSDLSTIWIKRGKYAEKAIMPLGFEPDVTMTSLEELPTLIDNSTIE